MLRKGDSVLIHLQGGPCPPSPRGGAAWSLFPQLAALGRALRARRMVFGHLDPRLRVARIAARSSAIVVVAVPMRPTTMPAAWFASTVASSNEPPAPSARAQV